MKSTLSPPRAYDQAFAERLAARDVEALGELYDREFPRVYRFVRRQIAEDSTAEDLTQEIFLHLYRALPRYDPARAVRPWLFTIAANKLRDYWRSHRRREELVDESSDERAFANLPEAVEGPLEQLAIEEDRQRVRDAIDTLPEGMRETVRLRALEELPFAEVARSLDRNVSAARKRYSRALDRLRIFFETDCAEPTRGCA